MYETACARESRVTVLPLVILDHKGLVTGWNGEASRQAGYPPNEAIGRHFGFLFLAADQAAGLPERDLLTAAADGIVAVENWVVRRDGSVFRASVITCVRRNRAGLLCGYENIFLALPDQAPRP
jgi:PAS domain S-box-containing protein